MRAGASMTRMVGDFKERGIKREARRGNRAAWWWEGKVKGDIRCQTG